MKKILFLLLLSTALHGQNTRKFHLSLKASTGYYKNQASYLDTKESVINTETGDMYNFKPYTDRLYILGAELRYKKFTANIEYYKPSFTMKYDRKIKFPWSKPYYDPDFELPIVETNFYALRLGYVFPFWKKRLELNSNIGIGYSDTRFSAPSWYSSMGFDGSNDGRFSGTIYTSNQYRQINIQLGVELNLKLSKNETHNLFLSCLVNKNTSYIYSEYYYWDYGKLKYFIKNEGNFAYLALGYKLRLL